VLALVGLLVAIPLVAGHLTRQGPDQVTATAQPPVADPQPGTDGPGRNGQVGAPATAPALPSAAPSASATPGPLVSVAASASPPPAASRSSVPAVPAPQAPATFSAVAGEGCPTGSFDRIGTYTSGSAGWYRKSQGGWSGDGCSGAYWAVPMSGDPARDEPGSAVVWSFHTSPVVAGNCQLGVFVPTGNSQQDVAGKPAWYRVSGGATFAVDQVANRGSWVSAGTFPVRSGQLSITLLTRGADPGNEHLAAAQTRISCRTK
jgi:translation initiation factor IF-2